MAYLATIANSLLRLAVERADAEAPAAQPEQYEISAEARHLPLIYNNGQQPHFSRSTSSGARWIYDELESTHCFMAAEHRFANDWQVKLAATLNVNNLFDEKYYSGIGGSVGYYGDPRNASLNLRYDF